MLDPIACINRGAVHVLNKSCPRLDWSCSLHQLIKFLAILSKDCRSCQQQEHSGQLHAVHIQIMKIEPDCLQQTGQCSK